MVYSNSVVFTDRRRRALYGSHGGDFAPPKLIAFHPPLRPVLHSARDDSAGLNLRRFPREEVAY